MQCPQTWQDTRRWQTSRGQGTRHWSLSNIKKKNRLKQRREQSTVQAPHRGDLHTSICNLLMMLICTFQCVLFVEIFPVSLLSDIDKKSFPPLVVNLKLDPIRFVLCTQVATDCEKVLRYFLCVSVCEYSYVTVCEEKTYFCQYLASADNTVLHPQINHSLTSWAVSHMLHHSCSVTSKKRYSADWWLFSLDGHLMPWWLSQL